MVWFYSAPGMVYRKGAAYLRVWACHCGIGADFILDNPLEIVAHFVRDFALGTHIPSIVLPALATQAIKAFEQDVYQGDREQGEANIIQKDFEAKKEAQNPQKIRIIKQKTSSVM